MKMRSNESVEPTAARALCFDVELQAGGGSRITFGNMTAREHSTKRWLEAANDLGFKFIPDFTLQDGADNLTYLGLVPEFGGDRGMLIITERESSRHIRAAEQHGYGYSCMSEHFEPYDRDTYVELLNDWGWSGPPDCRPAWYTGEPWTS